MSDGFCPGDSGEHLTYALPQNFDVWMRHHEKMCSGYWNATEQISRQNGIPTQHAAWMLPLLERARLLCREEMHGYGNRLYSVT